MDDSKLDIGNENNEREPLIKHNQRVTTPVRTGRRNSSSGISLFRKTAYGFGHVFNDISAAMWFSYALLFLQTVIGMPPVIAGVMLLIGQLADGIATPFVGVFIDKFGTRKIWHIAGSLLVLVSFPMIFLKCPGCSNASSGLIAFYYAVVITVFQTGWAIVQISHLALIPDLTPFQHGRTELTAIRYTASVCSSITVYAITWSVFHATQVTGMDKIGPEDAFKFRDIVIIGAVLGVITTSVFHLGLRKLNTQPLHNIIIQPEHGYEAIKICDYLRSPVLFQVASLYVTSRLFLTISLVYMPLYLNESFNEGEELLASVPLVCYVSSFIASMGIKYINKVYGSKLCYLFGAIVSISGCLMIRFGMVPQYLLFCIYGVAVLLGMGSSITMVTSLCFTADLIGTDTKSGGFVYGAVTFFDKVLNGIAVMIIEDFKCEEAALCPHYYRDVLAYVCGGSALVGIAVLLSLATVTIGKEQQEERNGILGKNMDYSKEPIQISAQLQQEAQNVLRTTN